MIILKVTYTMLKLWRAHDIFIKKIFSRIKKRHSLLVVWYKYNSTEGKIKYDAKWGKNKLISFKRPFTYSRS